MHATKKKESAPAEAKNQGGVKEKKPESSPSHVNPLWLQLATGFEAPEEAYAGDSRLCVQTKLAVGAPDDPYEQEADRIADQVLRMHTPVIQPKPTRPFAKDPSCGDELQPLQAKSASRTKRQSGPEAILYSAPSDGQPLASSTRSFFEPRFGADFSQVRVHTDARAQRAARDINAKAFTHRNNIFLGTGQSSSDLGLMAHELTHTIQQGGASVEMSGGVQASCAVSHPSDVLEQEADQVDRRGVGGETSIGTITAGGMEQVQRLELPSWADVVSGAEELYEEAVETGEEALEWAEETAEEVGETVGEGMEWVATTAGQAAFDAANTLAGLFGGSVIIRRGCIIVTIPNIPLFPTFQKTLGETPPLGFFVPFAAGGTLIGPLPVAGMVGALAYAQLSAEAAVGPGVLRNVRVEICPFAGRYMGTAQLYAAAAIAPRLTLFGGLFAVGGVLIPMEPPIPIIAIIEGGLRGIGTGWLIGAVQDTVTVLYSGGTLSFSNVAELMGGVLLQGDLQLFAALRLFDRIICQYAHPLGHWETGRAMQLTIPISSALSGSGGTGGVGPITWGPIPIGDIETAIRPLPTGWNCLGWAEIKQILYDNGMLPPQLCEGEEEGEPGVLRNQLALAICKCVDIERKPGEPECGAGKRYLKCFEIDETICKKKGQLQKEADRRCNHDPDLLEKCNRQGGCRFKHTKAMCPVSEDRCKDGYFSTMLEVPDHHEPSPRVPMLPEDVAEHAQRLIDRENYAAALEVVVSGLRLNLDLCYFTYVNRTDAGEGLTTTNYRLDPDTGNYVPDGRSRVEIYSPAFATLPWLVSTVMHEYQHVLQGQRQTTPEELDDPTGEHTAASEVEAYLWEIENAERTGTGRGHTPNSGYGGAFNRPL